MPLEDGIYTITSSERPVGRYHIEDRSLLPKRVFLLPQDVQAPHFTIQKTDNGYHIQAQGALLSIIDDRVFAMLIDSHPAEEWVITEQPQHGPNIFTVEKQDRTGGWIAKPDEEEGPDAQVNVRPLIATKSLPPMYLPSELFTFTRVDEDY